MSDCPWCKLPEAEHRAGLVDHAFQAEVPGLSAPMAKVRASEFAGDPVLRRALIDKGVLTLHDLRRAESKIRTMSKEKPDG